MDGALDQAAMADDGHRLLGVEVPPVEPHRPVEPERVVEAEPGDRARARHLGWERKAMSSRK